MVYKFKEGSRWSVDANVAGLVCEQLASRGELTAENLVEVSRAEDAPLHKCFTWDDAVAAEKYRNQEARCIIGSLEIVESETQTPVRGFYHISIDTSAPAYEPTNVILRDEDKRAELLKIAKGELKAFKKKYEKLTELAKVLSAIDEIVQE